jgi:hypothetical protein
MLLADGKRALVGSIDLAPGCVEERRELAIETDAHPVIKRLAETVTHDWAHSKPIDLSDEGLLEDLGKRNRADKGAAMLALGTKKAVKAKKK